MPEPDLIFPPSFHQDGFTTNVTSRQAGEPDPVVRELLQNGLDAAIREAGRDRAEIHFTIAECPLSSLPGLGSYRRAFEAARQRHEQGATNDVRLAIERIATVLSEATMSVLFCRDNGVGLDQTRMTALLSEGQSDKAYKGAGSYGLGHLTAYAASDLRYVFYAGVGRQRRIASGHTILASHKRGNVLHSSHGYWQVPTDMFSLEDGAYPHQVPQLLHDEVGAIRESGAVIAILGFNYFHDDERAQAADDICRVAALNFMGAIHGGTLIVHVHDERTNTSKTVDGNSLRQFLEQKEIRDQQRAPVRGWLAGSQGYRAVQTLEDGLQLDRLVDRSIRVHFRRLDAGSSEPSRVQIFRDGMWITNNAPELGTGAFSGVQPFDAVVSLSDADPEDHTEFYDLVRNAEGPEHRGLSKLREMRKRDRDTLRGKLRQLAERLREEAGEIDEDEGFTPSGFAVFNKDIKREAQKVPLRRIRLASIDEDEQSTDSTGGETDETPDSEQPGKRRGGSHSRRAPAAGTAVKMRRSLVPMIGANGAASRLRAMLDVSSNSSSSSGKLGLRVYIESGSDETCEQPIAPDWQPIRSVQINGGVIDAKDETEVRIPVPVGAIEIELAEPLIASAQYELDVVRRSGKESQS